MAVMERPIISHIVNLPDARETWGLDSVIRATVSRLLSLDYDGWRKRFADSGFTDAQVESLEAVVQDWISQIDVDALRKRLRTVSNISDTGDESELGQTLGDWMERIPKEEVANQVVEGNYPNSLEALCYAMSRMGQIASSAVGFEMMRRDWAETPEPDWTLTPDQIAEGTALAEAGLAEDARTWPPY